MRKALLLGLAMTFGLSMVPVAFSEEVNMDTPYGDRAPGGYQHVTTHYHNYWRRHHHPWSNIERERFVIRQAQDFENLTRIQEGDPRAKFVRKSDSTVRARFQEYVWNREKTDFNDNLPAHVINDIKNRKQVSQSTRDNLKLNEFLPQPLSYNSITYLPDEFTEDKLDMPALRYKSGIVGNDLILFDTVTGRVRGLWRDVIQ